MSQHHIFYSQSNRLGMWHNIGASQMEYQTPMYRKLIDPKTILSIQRHFDQIYGKHPTSEDIRYALDRAYYTNPPYDAFLPLVSYQKSASQEKDYEEKRAKSYIQNAISTLNRSMKRYAFQEATYLRDIKQPTGYLSLDKAISDRAPSNILLHRNPF